MTRRLAAVLLALCALGAQAQSPYPGKFVRLVIPFPAATSPDVVMRLVGPQLSQMWASRW